MPYSIPFYEEFGCYHIGEESWFAVFCCYGPATVYFVTVSASFVNHNYVSEIPRHHTGVGIGLCRYFAYVVKTVEPTRSLPLTLQ